MRFFSLITVRSILHEENSSRILASHCDTDVRFGSLSFDLTLMEIEEHNPHCINTEEGDTNWTEVRNRIPSIFS